MINKQNNKLGWLFASPYIIFGLVFFLGPLIWSLYLSFTTWDLIAPDFDFVGLDNFRKAMAHQGFNPPFGLPTNS